MLAARGGGRAPAIADAGAVRREIAAVERLGARYVSWATPPILRCSPSSKPRRPR